MPTTGTSCRRATSTILGTLIFVGIMFTAVIPMMLVMRQADTLHEMRKHELGVLDQEKDMERLYLYVYPLAPDEPTLIVKARNNGDLMVGVVRLWVNDEPYELDVDLPPMSEAAELKSVSLDSPPDQSTYYITATTDRGNLVAYETIMIWEDNVWSTGGVLSVNVLINSLNGFVFRIFVNGEGYSEDVWPVFKNEPKIFVVPSPGEYNVEIYQGWKLLYSDAVIITWPNGPPVEWVFA